jgi:hypothetical protein
MHSSHHLATSGRACHSLEVCVWGPKRNGAFWRLLALFGRASSIILFPRKPLGQIQKRTRTIAISAPEKDPAARVPGRQIKDAKQSTGADGPE